MHEQLEVAKCKKCGKIFGNFGNMLLLILNIELSYRNLLKIELSYRKPLHMGFYKNFTPNHQELGVNRLLILFTVFLVLNSLDTVTTFVGLTNGKATEINPFHTSLNMKGIDMQFVLIKNVVVPLIFCVFLYACLKVVTGHYKIPYYTILIGLTIFYLAVVINNLKVIYKL